MHINLQCCMVFVTLQTHCYLCFDLLSKFDSPFFSCQDANVKKHKKNKGIKKRERQASRHTDRMFSPIPAQFDPFTQSSVTIEELFEEEDGPLVSGGSSGSTDLPNPVIAIDDDEGSQTNISVITGDILIGGNIYYESLDNNNTNMF